MRLTLVAVGRARVGGRGAALARLYEDYAERLEKGPWGPLRLKEVEERRAVPSAERPAREAALIRQALPEGAYRILLDERGRSLDSRAFATHLQGIAESGRAELAFVIGGADGLDEGLRGEADLLLSLGAMTWPHLLVRVLLAEQLFRAQSILSGHPYHRD